MAEVTVQYNSIPIQIQYNIKNTKGYDKATVYNMLSRANNTIRYDTIEEINVDSKAEYTA